MKSIKCVAVIGAGTMGHGIAQIFAQAGKRVVLVEAYPEVLKTAKTKMQQSIEMLLANGFLKTGSLEEILSRVEFAAKTAAAKDADMVIEAIPEKVSLKEILFKELTTICRPDCIFASNTSGIPITNLAGFVQHPERVIGTHFFMPAQLVPLVEIVQTEKTSAEVIETTVELMKSIGKLPVRVKKDVPGFIGNRLQQALAREAMSLVQKGIAAAEDIDTVVKSSLAIRMIFTGPMEQRDLNGLDTHMFVNEYLYPELEDAKVPLEIIRSKVAAGELGLKTGKGFCDWSGTTPQEVTNRKNQELIDVLKFLNSR